MRMCFAFNYHFCLRFCSPSFKKGASILSIYLFPFDFYLLNVSQRLSKIAILFFFFFQYSTLSSSRPEVFSKNGFLVISQNSKINTCARDSFLIKLQLVIKFQPAALLKKSLWHRSFYVNFVKFPRTLFYRTFLVAAVAI